MSTAPISLDVTGDSPQGPPLTVDELQRVCAGQQARMQQLVTVKTEAIEAKQDAIGEQEFAQDLADDTARMQDGERHKYDLLVRLARRSIAEKRVIKEEELKHITDLRWQDAAAATAEQDRLDAQQQSPSPAPKPMGNASPSTTTVGAGAFRAGYMGLSFGLRRAVADGGPLANEHFRRAAAA